MNPVPSNVFTSLLQELKSGSDEAAEQLMTLVYHELRKLAAYYMSRERGEHTLQPTALVNEAYLDLFGTGGSKPMVFENRAHFFAVAARQMRRILVDHARKRNAEMRGGGEANLSLDAAPEPGVMRDREYTALDDALSILERENPRASQVVELCFFAGSTQKEAADILGISLATVQRDWEFARRFLYQQLAANPETPA